MITSMIVSFLTMVAFGVPIVFSMGISATFGLIAGDISVRLLISRIFTGIDSYPLLAVPFFILVGEIMMQGRVTERIVRFSNAIFGHVTGALAQINIVTSMLFGGMQGSATADVSSVGSILIPIMKNQGYSKALSVAVTSVSSMIGALVPPSMLMIIYGSIAQVSIAELFAGGLLPGIMVAVGLMVLSYFLGKREGIGKVREKVDLREVVLSIKDSGFALLLPIIIMGGILGGIFTATEAGVIGVVYAIFISVFVYKQLKPKDFLPVAFRAATTASICLLFIGTTSIFSWLLAYGGVPDTLVEALLSFTNDRTIIILMIVGTIFLIGLFVEGVPILIMATAVLVPVASTFGFDLVHFGVILVMVCLVGAVTPPIGILFYIACSIADTTPARSSITMLPFVGVYILVLVLAIAFPPLVTFLPELLMR